MDTHHWTVQAGSRVHGVDPRTFTTHHGRVTEVHAGPATSNGRWDVTITCGLGNSERRVGVTGFAPLFKVGDRCYLRGAPGPLGTVTRATSSTVDVVFDDGSGYHGDDSGVQYAGARE